MPGSLNMRYPSLRGITPVGDSLHEVAISSGNRVQFCRAFGERRVMAVQVAQEAGFSPPVGWTRGLEGGVSIEQ
jgi:hypothetical protein